MWKRKKHILVLMPDRFNNAMGGMGANSVYVFEKLQKEFSFSVVGYPDALPKPAYIKEYRDAVNPLLDVHFGPLLTLEGQIEYFYQATQCEKPDLIYAYDWSVGLAALRAADYFKIPLVFRVSLSFDKMVDDGLFLGLNPKVAGEMAILRGLRNMEILGLKRADRVIQVSNGYAKRFEKQEYLKDKTVIIPNGINAEIWKKEKEVTLPGTRKLKLVYIGRFAEMKGIGLLCNASLPESVDLIFIGAMEENIFSEMVKKAVSERENVHYIGALYGQDKIDALFAADGVIMPSRHEPFGTVGLEALASNNIILSSCVDGLGDYLPEVAIRFDLSSASISEAIRKFVSLFEPRGEVERMEKLEKGTEIVKKYNWTVAAAKLGEVFRNLV